MASQCSVCARGQLVTATGQWSASFAGTPICSLITISVVVLGSVVAGASEMEGRVTASVDLDGVSPCLLEFQASYEAIRSLRCRVYSLAKVEPRDQDHGLRSYNGWSVVRADDVLFRADGGLIRSERTFYGQGGEPEYKVIRSYDGEVVYTYNFFHKEGKVRAPTGGDIGLHVNPLTVVGWRTALSFSQFEECLSDMVARWPVEVTDSHGAFILRDPYGNPDNVAFQDVHFTLSPDHGYLPRSIAVVLRSARSESENAWYWLTVDRFSSPAPGIWIPVDFTRTTRQVSRDESGKVVENRSESRYIVDVASIVVNEHLESEEFAFAFPKDGVYYDFRINQYVGGLSRRPLSHEVGGIWWWVGGCLTAATLAIVVFYLRWRRNHMV